MASNFKVLAALLFFCGLTFAAQPVIAQDGTSEAEAADCISGTGASFTDSDCFDASDILGKLDLSVPENSLFAVMGTTPDTIIRPKGGDKFAASVLPQIADAFGNEQYAIGIEINPGLAMMPERYTQSELLGEAGRASGSRERVQRLKTSKILSNFTLTGAATQSTDDGKKNTYGLGINYNFDSGSPFNAQRDYAQCLTTAAMQTGPDPVGLYVLDIYQQIISEQILAGQPTTAEAIEPILQKRLAEDKKYLDMREAANNQRSKCMEAVQPWNRNTYGAGIAAFRSEVSPATPAGTPVEEVSETGFGAWASATFKTGDNGQFVLGAKWTDNAVRQREQDSEKVTETVDGWQVGTRYIHSISEDKDSDGSTSRSVRGFVEVAYAEEKFGEIEDQFTQAGLGFEIQLQKNLFFQVNVGDTFDSKIERGTYLTGQVKWAFSQKPAS